MHILEVVLMQLHSSLQVLPFLASFLNSYEKTPAFGIFRTFSRAPILPCAPSGAPKPLARMQHEDRTALPCR
jgi:hypothetical protein